MLANEGSPKFNFKVTWAPFLLRPQMPVDGVAKAPNTLSNPRVGKRLKAAGEPVGINFTGKTDRYPNTLLAHVLLRFALEKGGWQVQNQISEILFRHYFTDGLYPNMTNLALAGKEAGLNAEEVKIYLSNEDHIQSVKKEALRFSRSGVSGVPFFVINDEPVFSGAQPVERFMQAFHKAS